MASRSSSTSAASRLKNNPLLRAKYRELTRKHLSRLLDRIFAEFTGLHFHIAWAPSLPHDWSARTLPTGCSMCCQLAGTTVESQAYCQTCGPRQLARALRTDGEGHSFLCRLGVRNYWFPIHVRGVVVGIAYLQALDHAEREQSAFRASARAEATELNRPDFNRAGRLLRLIVQHLQIQGLAELRLADLSNARQALAGLEKQHTQLRKELDRIVPAARTPAKPEPETHAEQVMRRLVEQVQRNYAQPITLQRCAVSLAMNASYLSALFSRVVGMPFKTYLTEVRMEKARQMLGDPIRNISDIAAAVGYGSENRFRSAFKKLSGLSPKSWRETFHAVKLLLLLGWLLGELEFIAAAGAPFL